MGANNSKRRSTLKSFRHKQIEVLTHHKENLEGILKTIEENEINFHDDNYRKLNEDLHNIEGELHRMKRFVKPNNKKKHEYLLNMTHDLMKMLSNKVNEHLHPNNKESNPGVINNNQREIVKVAAPKFARKSQELNISEDDGSKATNNVQLKVVQLKLNETLGNEDADDPFTKLHAIRRNLEDVKPKIYLFGGTNKSFEYCVLLQEINNVRMDLIKLGDFDAAHMKHEQKLALKETDECLKLLDSKAAFNEVVPEPRIISEQKVTFDQPSAETESNSSKTKDETNKVEFDDCIKSNVGIVHEKISSSSVSDDDYDIVYDSTEDLQATNKPVAVTSF